MDNTPNDLYTDVIELIFENQNLTSALRYILRMAKAPEPFINGLIKECREAAQLKAKKGGNLNEHQTNAR